MSSLWKRLLEVIPSDVVWPTSFKGLEEYQVILVAMEYVERMVLFTVVEYATMDDWELIISELHLRPNIGFTKRIYHNRKTEERRVVWWFKDDVHPHCARE